MKNIKEEFKNSYLFKDPVYGIKGPFFFPGTSEDVNTWACTIFEHVENIPLMARYNIPLDASLLEGVSPKYLLKESKELSGVEELMADEDYERWLKISTDEFQWLHDWVNGLENYFEELFTPIADWDPFDLFMSLFYKDICYSNFPFLGVICDFETFAFNPAFDKDLIEPDFRQNIIKVYLAGDIERAFLLSGNRCIFENKEKRYCGVGYEWFFHICDMYIHYTSDRERIKKEMMALFTRNLWILDDPGVKKSLKEGFVRRIVSCTTPSDKQTLIKNKMPQGFDEIVFFFLKLFFPYAPISEYESVFENSTVDQFIDKLECLQLKQPNL